MQQKLPIIFVPKDKTITSVMKDNSNIIVNYVISAIESALSLDKTEVDIFMVEFEIGLPTTRFKISRDKWKPFLNKMIDNAVTQEYYELAAKLKKTLDKLDIQI